MQDKIEEIKTLLDSLKDDLTALEQKEDNVVSRVNLRSLDWYDNEGYRIHIGFDFTVSIIVPSLTESHYYTDKKEWLSLSAHGNSFDFVAQQILCRDSDLHMFPDRPTALGFAIKKAVELINAQ